MKKIIIATYFFQPCTLTPSQRVTYWAENFHKLGYSPIIVTREWDTEIESYFDTKKKVGNTIRHVIYKNYEVYYIPFKPGILDKSYVNWGENYLRPLFLAVKLLDIFLVNFTLKYTSYHGYVPVIKSILNKEKISSLLISGAPFYLFKLGYIIRKESKIPWFADYRDDWTTNEIEIQKGGSILRKFINFIERKYEKKWVGSAEKVISVTDFYTKRISKLVGKKGITIENGFDDDILKLESIPLFNEFTLVYSGTLYPFQDLSIVLEALNIFLSQGKKFNLVFLGSGFDVKEKRRIDSLIAEELKPYVKITNRLSRKEALQFMQQSHVLLSISYGALKGIPSSKLYEYIGLRKPVLLCPSDKDVMENMLTDAGVCYVANTAEECFLQIEAIMKIYSSQDTKFFTNNPNQKISKYTRASQLAKLDGVL